MPTSLTPAQIAAYDREGYVFPLPALSPAESQEVSRKLEAFEAESGLEAVKVIRNKGHLKLTFLNALVSHPTVLDAVEGVLGPDVLCWGSSLFVKEAGAADYVAWHQDAHYWGLEPDDVVSAWIALQPSTLENGAMQVIPGSHRDQPLPHGPSAPGSKNMLFTAEELAVDVDTARAVPLILAQGEMSLHHVGIVHGSEPNRSAGRRMGYAIRYVAPHVRQRDLRNTALLVRGEDRHGNFGPDPVPTRDMDPEIVAFVDAPFGPSGAVRGVR